MATTTTLPTEPTVQRKVSSDYINNLYDSQLAGQKSTLESAYNQNMTNLDKELADTRQQTDNNLTRTYVEAQKNAKNYGEVQNAYGLTSGAMAQARLAQGNQLRDDLTNLRTVQANAEADIGRQRTLYGKQYAADIAKAQADNDMARAEALYKDAKQKEDDLLQQQQTIAELFAKKGDYSYLAQLYGLTADQLAALQGGGSGGGHSGYYKSSGKGKDTDDDPGNVKDYGTYDMPAHENSAYWSTAQDNAIIKAMSAANKVVPNEALWARGSAYNGTTARKPIYKGY